MRKAMLAVFLVFGLMAFSRADLYGAHGESRQPRKAILLAAFGTTVPEARTALDAVEKRAREAFPGVEIRWAYTSGIVRKKLATQGQVFHSPETALSMLMDEGFTHVAVLSLHTIPGEEFHDLNRNARLFGQMAGGFEQIVVAMPLLYSHDDFTRVAKTLIDAVPKGRKRGEAVLFMGHGTEHHPSDAIYSAMNQILQEMDANVLLGTVEGHPSLEELLPKLREKKPGKVYLMPFMAVAGDHAQNDMAGDEPDSWKSILKKEGYACEAVLKGTAEYPQVLEVWMDHLREAFAKLE